MGASLLWGRGGRQGGEFGNPREKETVFRGRGRGQRKNFVSLLGLDTFAILFLFSKK